MKRSDMIAVILIILILCPGAARADSATLRPMLSYGETTKSLELLLYIEEAKKLIGTGEYAEAKEVLRKAINLDTNFSLAWRHLAILYYDGGEYNDAIPAFLNALLNDPQNTQVYFYLGNCFHKQGMRPQALMCFKLAYDVRRGRIPSDLPNKEIFDEYKDDIIKVDEINDRQEKIALMKEQKRVLADRQLGEDLSIKIDDFVVFDSPDITLENLPIHLATYLANPDITSVAIVPYPWASGIAGSKETVHPISPYFIFFLGEKDVLAKIDKTKPIFESLQELKIGRDHNVVLFKDIGMLSAGKSSLEAVDRACLLHENIKAFLSFSIGAIAGKLEIKTKLFDNELGERGFARPLRDQQIYEGESLEEVAPKIKKDLIEHGRRMHEGGIVSGPGGNLSYLWTDKDGRGYLFIKATGAYLSNLSQDDIVIVDIENGRTINSLKKPSGDIDVHIEFFKRNNISKGSLLHAHPPVMRGMLDTDNNFAPSFIEPISYQLPWGSRELVHLVSLKHGEFPVLAWKKHGMSSIGISPREAVDRAIDIERHAEMELFYLFFEIRKYIPDIVEDVDLEKILTLNYSEYSKYWNEIVIFTRRLMNYIVENNIDMSIYALTNQEIIKVIKYMEDRARFLARPPAAASL
jgi:ribulose-5-phosphate 4-epimerase/fuculose-1-phosphate aldolase